MELASWIGKDKFGNLCLFEGFRDKETKEPHGLVRVSKSHAILETAYKSGHEHGLTIVYWSDSELDVAVVYYENGKEKSAFHFSTQKFETKDR